MAKYLSFFLLFTWASLCHSDPKSCKGRCGQGYYRGSLCQCDYECLGLNECCTDFKSLCTTKSSCKGRCGEPFDRGNTCHCDNDCIAYNQCCPDYESLCLVEESSNEDMADFEGAEVAEDLPTPVEESASAYLPGEQLSEVTTISTEGPTSTVSTEGSTTEDLTTTISTEGPTTITPTEDLATTVSTEGATTVIPTEDLATTMSTVDPTSVIPTEDLATTISTESPTTITPTEDLATTVSTEGTTTVIPTEDLATTIPTEGPTSVIPTEDLATTIPTEGPTSVIPTEGPTTVMPTEDLATTIPTEGLTTVKPTEGMTITIPTESPSSTVSEDLATTVSTQGPTTSAIPTEDLATTISTEGPTSTEPKADMGSTSTTVKPIKKPIKPSSENNDKTDPDSNMYQADDYDSNLCSGRPVSGLTTLRNGTIVVFRGHYFWTLDKNRNPEPPRLITDVWGIPSPIDTVYTRCNCEGKTYFFKGNKYWRFENDIMDPGFPKAITHGFGRISHITAALSMPQYRSRRESVIFFKRGGLAQKYTYQVTPKCGRKPSIPVVTVRNRYRRDADVAININISKQWRGFPTVVTSAVSVPSRVKEGYKYYVFSHSKTYSVKMEREKPVILKPANSQKENTANSFFKCPNKV